MGDHNVSSIDEAERRAFTKALLDDVIALERLLDLGRFETGTRRIGAEQEMFLIGPRCEPAMMAPQILERIDDPRVTTELAQYNLECNLSPLVFGGDCLRQMEAELHEVLGVVRQAAAQVDTEYVLTGCLPTLYGANLTLENMTPNPRYFELNRVMSRLRGGNFHVLIKGADQLEATYDTVMLESCNASFQVHFQTAPEEFARLYNLAQAVTAPVLAAAVNSPVLLRKRLWAETRIAVFERSVDTRSTAQQNRGGRPRVHFGDNWIEDSILEIFREDIARFPVVVAGELDDDPVQVMAAGGTPKLSALRMHNSTVYRWNRPCYGIMDGVPHLRIENRVLPSGPTVVDEVANAAFFFGLMAALGDQDPVENRMDFVDARSNFLAAARHGLEARFHWLDGKQTGARELILGELIPLACEGLRSNDIDEDDINRYLGTLRARVDCGLTGSEWVNRSLAEMGERGTPDQRFRQLVHSMRDPDLQDRPVHTWPGVDLPEEGSEDWRSSFLTIGQVMQTDVFTVRPHDIITLAASVMDWRQIRYLPVETEEGELVGLVSRRALVRLIARGMERHGDLPTVAEVMATDLVTVTPETATVEAIHLMRDSRIGCLLVLQEGSLAGIVTERDLIKMSAKLLEDFLQDA